MVGHEDGAAAVDTAARRLPSVEQVERWIDLLQCDCSQLDDAERVDMLRVLERLKCCAEGTQAVLTADFDTSQRARAAEAGVPAARQGRGIAEQIALARRESPHRGQRHLSLAKILRDELPGTMAALRAGRITEWRATIVGRETACLSRDDRLKVDAELAGDPAAVDALEAMGERALDGLLKARAAALDPASVAQRRRRAEADRRTTLRPAPDTMTWFTACLTVKDGVAVHAALLREADRLKAAGDPRSRGQIMADTLVTRVVSPHLAAVAAGDELPITINLTVPDSVLLGDEDGAGHVDGYGEVPGDLVREWTATHLEQDVAVWLRRLYVRPATGELVAMDSRARAFPAALAGFLRLRDRRCRTPWCGAPIRHHDHAVEHQDGGPTSGANGQGLCEACNHAKQARGWRARPRPGPRHTIETTTPTGHRYRSTAPPLAPPVAPRRTHPSGRKRPAPRLHLVHGGPELAYEPDVA